MTPEKLPRKGLYDGVITLKEAVAKLVRKTNNGILLRGAYTGRYLKPGDDFNVQLFLQDQSGELTTLLSSPFKYRVIRPSSKEPVECSLLSANPRDNERELYTFVPNPPQEYNLRNNVKVLVQIVDELFDNKKTQEIPIQRRLRKRFE